MTKSFIFRILTVKSLLKKEGAFLKTRGKNVVIIMHRSYERNLHPIVTFTLQ